MVKSFTVPPPSPLPDLNSAKEIFDSFKVRIATLEKENKILRSTVDAVS